MEATTTIGTVDPSRLTDRPDPPGPCRIPGTYGAPRVHVELTMGYGITVGQLPLSASGCQLR